MADEVKCGIYRHSKGGLYFAQCEVTHSETGEKLVVYFGEDGRGWARPKEMWDQSVTCPRFATVKK